MSLSTPENSPFAIRLAKVVQPEATWFINVRTTMNVAVFDAANLTATTWLLGKEFTVHCDSADELQEFLESRGNTVVGVITRD